MFEVLEPTLEKLGLNKTEIRVYLTLLPLGIAPASAVGNRLSMPRSTAKYTCQQLAEKGLITQSIKNNTVFYAAKNPDSLHTLLYKEKKSLTDKEADLHRVIGDLKNLFHPQQILPKVVFFEGLENIKKMFEDVLEEKQTLYGVLRIDSHIHPEILAYLNDIYIPRRKVLQNPSWMIFNDTPQTREYQGNDKDVNRTTLLVPEKSFPFEVCFHIYGNKVAFYSYEEYDLTGVIIQNSLIRTTQFSLFNLAWHYARLLKVNKQYQKIDLS